MKIVLFVFMVCLTFSVYAEDKAFSEKMDEATQISIDYAQKIHKLQSEFHEGQYQKKITHFKKMGTLSKEMKSGDTEANKAVMEKMMKEKREFKRSQKEAGKEFRNGEIKVLQKEMREKIRAIHKELGLDFGKMKGERGNRKDRHEGRGRGMARDRGMGRDRDGDGDGRRGYGMDDED